MKTNLDKSIERFAATSEGTFLMRDDSNSDLLWAEYRTKCRSCQQLV